MRAKALVGVVLGWCVVLGGGAPAAAAACDGTTVACRVGDTGPGGGVVFYDAGAPRQWGRYLEVAPAGWAGGSEEPTAAWCRGGFRSPGYRGPLPTSTRVGSGRANTTVIVDACGKDSAAGAAAAYRGGGLSDWFLPSKGELNLLYRKKAIIGSGGTDEDVWSSSESTRIRSYAWGQGFGDGYQGEGSKSLNLRVRPVRAF